MAAVTVDGNHHVIGLHVSHLRRRSLEHVHRIGAAVVLVEQHADTAAVIGGVGGRGRGGETAGIVIAQIRVLRGNGERIEHLGGGGVKIIGIKAVLVHNGLDLAHASRKRIVSLLRLRSLRLRILSARELRKAQRIEQLHVSANGEAADKCGGYDDDQAKQLRELYVAGPRLTRGRRHVGKFIGMPWHACSSSATPSDNDAWRMPSRSGR